ncbi:MAG: hypothetical protein DME65_01270 [Verrucomicrobia bacterium]|nr:MAG: hypothetical protein DME65_01270 [Verrucomicrobiota bacterium]
MIFYPHLSGSFKLLLTRYSVRERVTQEKSASRSTVHQGNVTEEQILEKLTLKNVKAGGQSGKRKSKAGE